MNFQKGIIPWNKGKKMEYKHGMLGKHHEDKAKIKMSNAKLKNPTRYWLGKKLPNYKPPMLGKKHTEEWKHKRSLEMKGKKRPPELMKKILNTLRKSPKRFNGILSQQDRIQPTSLEKAVYDYLLSKGILFEKQKLINGRFIVDAYIPSLNLVIEADGNYWHTMDKIMKKDKAENAYLKKCGFKVIRLREQDIKQGEFKKQLQEVLN